MPNDRLFTEADLTKASDIRNRSLQKKYDALSAKVTELLEAQNPADRSLVAEHAAAKAALEALPALDPELAEMESRATDAQQQIAHYRSAYQQNERQRILTRLAYEENAVSVEQIDAMTREVANEDLPDAMRRLQRSAPNLFKCTTARGIAGGTSPAPAGNSERFQTGTDIGRMSDDQFMAARKAGKLDRYFGRKQT